MKSRRHARAKKSSITFFFLITTCGQSSKNERVGRLERLRNKGPRTCESEERARGARSGFAPLETGDTKKGKKGRRQKTIFEKITQRKKRNEKCNWKLASVVIPTPVRIEEMSERKSYAAGLRHKEPKTCERREKPPRCSSRIQALRNR